MNSHPAVRIGLISSLAIVAMVGVIWYLSHFNPDTYQIKVSFVDTSGLVRQAPVRMRGVVIGEVAEVELINLQPIVTMTIQDKIKIPADSKFSIVTGLLISNAHVEVTPGESATTVQPGQQVVGAIAAGSLTQISPELAQSVGKLNVTMDDLTKRFNVAAVKIDRVLDQSAHLVDDLDKTVGTARGLIGDARLKTSLIATVENFRTMSQNARDTSESLRSNLTQIAGNTRGSLHNLTDKLGNILTRIDSTIDAANTVVKKLTDQVTDPRLQQSLQETVELARATLARFDQIASDIHQLTGDAQMQSDLKQTLGNMKAASANGAQALNKVNEILGGVTGLGTKAKGFHLPATTVEANVSEQLLPTRLRVDVDGRLALGANMLDLGLYDLGQDTRLTLEGGFKPQPTLLLKYGLYASKLGVGLEWEPSQGTGFRGDLYDTSRPQLDIRGLFRVNSDASLWLGVDSLLRDPIPLVGVRFRQ